MRNCQICGHNGKRVILNDYNGQRMCLFECVDCGHRYIDALDLSQAYFDEYYLKYYRTDDFPYSDARLDSLADFAASYCSNVLDIGGMDGQLQKRLLERGIDCDVAGVGDEYPYHEGVILSHTLEHVYEVGAFLDGISCKWLFIEVPIHLAYLPPQEYDYHWQHVNKFRPRDLERLIKQKGYTMSVSMQIEDYREYKVWRLAASYASR